MVAAQVTCSGLHFIFSFFSFLEGTCSFGFSVVSFAGNAATPPDTLTYWSVYFQTRGPERRLRDFFCLLAPNAHHCCRRLGKSHAAWLWGGSVYG
jgi:hypothetical protein